AEVKETAEVKATAEVKETAAVEETAVVKQTAEVKETAVVKQTAEVKENDLADTAINQKPINKSQGTVSNLKKYSTSPMTKTVSEPLDSNTVIIIVAATERLAITKSERQAGSSFATNSASSETVKARL
ncbi:MAG TPA: ribonuclease E, partial [Psychromonas sp.]